MQELIILLIFSTIVLISGCVSQTEYVCSDGTVVSEPSLCQTTTTILGTTITISKLPEKFSNIVSCDIILGKLFVKALNNGTEPMTLNRLKISYTKFGTPNTMEVEPNVVIRRYFYQDYMFSITSCPDSVDLDITYTDSTGSHRETKTKNVVKL